MYKACSTIMNGEMVRNLLSHLLDQKYLGFQTLQGKNLECVALKIINKEIMACYLMKTSLFLHP